MKTEMNTPKQPEQKCKAATPAEENAPAYPDYPVWGEEADDFEPCMLTDADPDMERYEI